VAFQKDYQLRFPFKWLDTIDNTLLGDADTMPWVLADNSIVQVTKAELQEALRLSGAAMAELWVKPYA